MIPPHSFYGLFPDCWHILISLLRNRAMWRVAPGFVPGCRAENRRTPPDSIPCTWF